MTDKAQRIIDAMKARKRYSSIDPKTREKFLNDLNQSTLDTVGPVDQGMGVMNNMNDFQSDHEKFVKSFGPRPGVL